MGRKKDGMRFDDNSTGAFFNGMGVPGAFAGLQGGDDLLMIAAQGDARRVVACSCCGSDLQRLPDFPSHELAWMCVNPECWEREEVVFTL